MNRKQRRELLKKRRRANAGNPDVVDPQVWRYTGGSHLPKAPPEEQVPGVNCRPVDPEFEQKVARNSWHDRSELAPLMDKILRLSEEDNYDWSWAYNHECKYVDLRIDMRDGGFVMTDGSGKRINLEQLLWQYKSLPKEGI